MRCLRHNVMPGTPGLARCRWVSGAATVTAPAAAIAVAVSNRFDRVCSNDRAWITYQEFNQNRRCGILNVEEVTDRERALELVKEWKAGPPGSNGQEKTAAPERSGGR